MKGVVQDEWAEKSGAGTGLMAGQVPVGLDWLRVESQRILFETPSQQLTMVVCHWCPR
jgi:hypothetical protein